MTKTHKEVHMPTTPYHTYRLRIKRIPGRPGQQKLAGTLLVTCEPDRYNITSDTLQYPLGDTCYAGIGILIKRIVLFVDDKGTGYRYQGSQPAWFEHDPSEAIRKGVMSEVKDLVAHFVQTHPNTQIVQERIDIIRSYERAAEELNELEDELASRRELYRKTHSYVQDIKSQLSKITPLPELVVLKE
jgi:hypothetical protein